MKKFRPRLPVFKKSLAIFLVAALIVAGVFAGALAAGMTQQPPTTQPPSASLEPYYQQVQPYTSQQQPSMSQRGSMWMGSQADFGRTGMRNMMLRCGMAIAFLFCLACDILLLLIVLRDAKRKGLSPVFWGILVFLTTVLGLLIYLLYQQRKESPELQRPAPRPVPGRVCPNCGTVQNPDNAFCYVCGAQMELRCKKCGAPLHPAAIFCPVCGARAVKEKAPEPVATEAEQVEDQEQPKE
ncbi:MAG: zinc ribbon domain-containing protein [Defluviitaleaceae bacterium]|nr:zinc ribbon domain-containing protein [Defluviitaleaceae bacterium]